MWPNPDGLVLHGSKVQTLEHLSTIAHDMHMEYPLFFIIDEPPQWYPTQAIVIKRGFSCAADHVLIPPYNDKKLLSRWQTWMEEDESHYPRSVRSILRPLWFGIVFLPHMVSKGELRSYVVGGELAYTVGTWLKSDENDTVGFLWQPVSYLVPLDMMTQEVNMFFTNDHGDVLLKDCKRGIKEYRTFVLQVVRRLIRLEEAEAGGKSDLRVFCRVDISTYQDDQGEFHWMVNELARSQYTGLYATHSLSEARMAASSVMGILMDDASNRSKKK